MYPELLFGPFLRCLKISNDFLSIFFVIVGQNVHISHTQGFETKHTRHFLFVQEIRIAKLLEPIEIVEHGVIHTVRPARTHVSRWNSKMLQERSIVRSAA